MCLTCRAAGWWDRWWWWRLQTAAGRWASECHRQCTTSKCQPWRSSQMSSSHKPLQRKEEELHFLWKQSTAYFNINDESDIFICQLMIQHKCKVYVQPIVAIRPEPEPEYGYIYIYIGLYLNLFISVPRRRKQSSAVRLTLFGFYITQ